MGRDVLVLVGEIPRLVGHPPVGGKPRARAGGMEWGAMYSPLGPRARAGGMEWVKGGMSRAVGAALGRAGLREGCAGWGGDLQSQPPVVYESVLGYPG